ncbi:MAG: GntR family transcriptional regulator [Alcaligenaceae bacterium]
MQRAKTKHEHVANTIRERISYGVYAENQMLAPERLLCAEFNCSRHTIREALKTLADERLLLRKIGHGTIVAPHSSTEDTWGLTSIDDLIGEFTGGLTHSQHLVLKHGIISARTVPAVAELFGLKPTGAIYCIQRVLSLDTGPAAYGQLFTLVGYAARIPKELIGTAPLLGQIEKYCRVRAFRVRQIATAVEADAEVSKLLGVRKGAPMLKTRRTYQNREGVPFEYTEMTCRPDRYEQKVYFHRPD